MRHRRAAKSAEILGVQRTELALQDRLIEYPFRAQTPG